MFIKKNKKVKNNKAYYQYQLIRSVRTSAGPRQERVLNMGEEIGVEKDKWKELANAIQEKLLKENKLFFYDKQIEELSDYYCRLIEQNTLNRERLKNENEPDSGNNEESDYATIDVNTVSNSEDRSYGGEYLVDSIMDSYNFDTILSDLGLNSNQICTAKMLIGSRMLHPSSEQESARWLNEESSLGEFFGRSRKINDNTLHRIANLLWKNQTYLESKLSDTSKNLFSLEEKVILYDLTNTYFEGDKLNSTISNRGNSKEKRSDCPLVTLALTVDENGFPKNSKIYKGNVNEPDTLRAFLQEMNASGDLDKKTIVIDAGIATEDNIALLGHYKCNYIAVSRRKSFSEDFWDSAYDEEVALGDGKSNLKVKSVNEGDETFLLCHSEDKKLKEEGIVNRRQKRFEEELKKLHEGLHKKGKLKNYDKILEKIGRLKELYKVGDLYNITVKKDKNEKNAIAIDYERNNMNTQKHSSFGNYILRTNRIDLSNAEISKIHRSLTIVEDSFKSMKSHLGIRPIYHKNDFNSEAHIFITVLAYNFVIGLLKKLSLNKTWDTVCKMMDNYRRLTTIMKKNDGSVLHLRQNTEPNPQQKEIFSKLGEFKSKGLKRVKFTYNKNK